LLFFTFLHYMNFFDSLKLYFGKNMKKREKKICPKMVATGSNKKAAPFPLFLHFDFEVPVLNLFTRYSRGEHKEAMEISVIQQIVQLGIEREELRDEILVQCMRQLTRNPHPDQVRDSLHGDQQIVQLGIEREELRD
jgi:MyTH4 domain